MVTWDRCGKAVYVEFTSSLTDTNWTPAAGPIYGTNSTLTLPEGSRGGSFRVRSEP